MSIPVKTSDDFVKAQESLTQAEIEYEKRFGNGTLDRVIYFDPLNPQVEDFVKAAELLRRAVKNNKRLKQVPEEMWKTLVF